MSCSCSTGTGEAAASNLPGVRRETSWARRALRAPGRASPQGAFISSSSMSGALEARRPVTQIKGEGPGREAVVSAGPLVKLIARAKPPRLELFAFPSRAASRAFSLMSPLERRSCASVSSPAREGAGKRQRRSQMCWGKAVKAAPEPPGGPVPAPAAGERRVWGRGSQVPGVKAGPSWEGARSHNAA